MKDRVDSGAERMLTKAKLYAEYADSTMHKVAIPSSRVAALGISDWNDIFNLISFNSSVDNLQNVAIFLDSNISY